MNAELEKWIEENSYKFVRLFGGDGEDELCVTVNNLRALFEGKVLVPVSAMPAERADKHASERAALYNRGWDDCRSTVLAAAKEQGND